MPLPTQDQIEERMKEREKADPLGFECDLYISYLEPERAAKRVKLPLGWKSSPLDRDSILKEMQDYMAFAWDKANHCRGISANRSIQHFIAWAWLAGDADVAEAIDREFSDSYCLYGKPILRAICQHYGWSWESLDDGLWRNGEGGSCVTAENVPDKALVAR